jgi:LPXTG-motif cell wall-anchored protein
MTSSSSLHSFRHSMVVTTGVKVLAWIVVVLINFFFVFFSLLRGLQRGDHWQKLFLMACIFRESPLIPSHGQPTTLPPPSSPSLIEILVEILFYETTECVMVHYIIPSLFSSPLLSSSCHYAADLARHEVERAAVTVKSAIMKTFAKDKNVPIPRYPIILDAPRYLFVSTNVSQHFPHLLESVIIQSYHTCSPPDHSTPWSRAHSSSSSSSNIWWTRGSKSRGVKSFLTSLMQQFGSTSPALQRFLIHLMQPLLVSSLIFLWAFLFNHPLWLILLGGVLALGLFWFIVRKRRQQQDENQAAWIHPLDDLMKKEEQDETNSHDEYPPFDLADQEDANHDPDPVEEDASHDSNDEGSSESCLILSEEEDQSDRSRFDSFDSQFDDSLGGEISLDFSDSDFKVNFSLSQYLPSSHSHSSSSDQSSAVR